MKRTSMFDDNDPFISYGNCRKCDSKLDQRIFYTCEICNTGGITSGGWMLLIIFWANIIYYLIPWLH